MCYVFCSRSRTRICAHIKHKGIIMPLMRATSNKSRARILRRNVTNHYGTINEYTQSYPLPRGSGIARIGPSPNTIETRKPSREPGKNGEWRVGAGPPSIVERSAITHSEITDFRISRSRHERTTTRVTVHGVVGGQESRSFVRKIVGVLYA